MSSLRVLRSPRLTFHELEQLAVYGVSDEQLALRTDGDDVRFAQLTGSGAGFSGRGEHVPLEIQLQHLTREAVDHEDRVFADIEAAGKPGVFHLPDVFAVRIEHLDALVLAVRYP